jgi:HCOMODA/2-hydroxy-3-carboxy-muconic semialdehyde decarboxylase
MRPLKEISFTVEQMLAHIMTAAQRLDQLKHDLMAANRILARENVVDGYGHVSARHPDDPGQFLLSRSRSPELVTVDDLMTFTLDGKPVGGDTRPGYLERFIHGSIYAARPDVNAVVHSHAEDVVPYSISDVPLQAVFHQSGRMGAHIPVWEISDKFGDTNLLVTCVDHGADLAETLGANTVVLMRGHGFAAVAPTLFEVVSISVYLPTNARMLTTAKLLGGRVRTITPGEIAAMGPADVSQPAFQRGWEYWCKRAGVA